MPEYAFTLSCTPGEALWVVAELVEKRSEKERWRRNCPDCESAESFVAVLLGESMVEKAYTRYRVRHQAFSMSAFIT